MRCHKVSAEIEDHPETHRPETITKYVGTQADVRTTRQGYVDAHGVMKKDVKVEQVDIPMDKSGLLEFINNLVIGG